MIQFSWCIANVTKQILRVVVHILILQTGWNKKKATINTKNADDICFQYAISVALNSEEIELHPDRISNIKPFINKYNWKRINHPSKIDYWETFENNNLTIALNILYIKEKQIYPTYISKHSTIREKQMILLMIPNKKKKDSKLSLKDDGTIFQ